MTKFLGLILSFVLGVSLAFADMRMSVEQLRAFLKSSKSLGHPDKKVAEFLKQVKLTDKLDDATIEDMQGEGAGPRTVEALKVLRDASKSLSAPPPPAPKPQVILPPPPDSLEQGRVLKEVTEYAQEYTKHLPNFICTQVTRRNVDPQGQGFFRLIDTVTAKLTYFEQREEKKVVLVNNTPTQTDYEKLGGATSTGEFGSMMREIFMPDSQAQFEWERWATLRGKRMYVFSYHVPQERSKWRVTYENSQSIVPAYRGLIYIDKETLAVMRITLQGENIDPSFPVQAASTVLDYDYQKISGQDYILPLKATLEMRSGRTVLKNEEEFRMYKKFGAEATITFTPDPLPESDTKEQKEK